MRWRRHERCLSCARSCSTQTCAQPSQPGTRTSRWVSNWGKKSDCEIVFLTWPKKSVGISWIRPIFVNCEWIVFFFLNMLLKFYVLRNVPSFQAFLLMRLSPPWSCPWPRTPWARRQSPPWWIWWWSWHWPLRRGRKGPKGTLDEGASTSGFRQWCPCCGPQCLQPVEIIVKSTNGHLCEKKNLVLNQPRLYNTNEDIWYNWRCLHSISRRTKCI